MHITCAHVSPSFHSRTTPTVTEAHLRARALLPHSPSVSTDTHHPPMWCLNHRPEITVTTGRPYYRLPRFERFFPHPRSTWLSRAQPIRTPRRLHPETNSTHLAQRENSEKTEGKPKIRRDRCPLGNVVRA